MKRLLIVIPLVLLVLSCAPVLRPDLMEQGARVIPFQEMKQHPAPYQGRLFILGGIILKTTLTREGSEIEALYVPVNQRGYFTYGAASNVRFLAVFPKKTGILDPYVYTKDREITLAGVFSGLESGKIDEMEYVYPVFDIVEIYLWDDRAYYGPAASPYYYYSPGWYPYGWYDPWGRPYYWHRYPRW
jgi:outer membrane lipoprotein